MLLLVQEIIQEIIQSLKAKKFLEFFYFYRTFFFLQFIFYENTMYT